MSNLRPDEIASVLKREIEGFDIDLAMEEVGTVLEVGDGIARVYGLEKVMANEMVQFENGAFGMAFNLEEDSVGIVILGGYLHPRGPDGQAHAARALGARGRGAHQPRRHAARRADRRQ